MNISMNEFLKSFDDLNRKDFDCKDIFSSLEEKFEHINTTESQCEKYVFYFGDFFIKTLKEVRKDLKETYIAYATNRLNEVVHPVLKYAYLKTLLKLKSNNQYFIEYLESIVKIVKEGYFNRERILSVYSLVENNFGKALHNGKLELINQFKNSLIQFEKKYGGTDDNIASLGWSYRILVTELKSDKISLLDSEVNDIVSDLFDKFCLFIEKEKNMNVHRIGSLLLKHYYENNDGIRFKEVVERLSKVYYSGNTNLSNIQARHKLIQFINLLMPFKDKLRDLYKHTLREIRQLDIERSDFSSERQSQVRVIKKDTLLDAIDKLKDKKKVEIICTMARLQIPTRMNAFEYIEKDFVHNFLFYFCTEIGIEDYENRIIDTIDPISLDTNITIEKCKEHVSYRYGLMLYEQNIYVNEYFDILFKQSYVSINDLCEFILSSGIISNERINIINIALHHYYLGNSLVFVHLIIPQIENIVRSQLEEDTNIYTLNDGKFSLILLKDVLEKARRKFDHDLCDYLVILLNDTKGWNLRNKVCHGLVNDKGFSMGKANRVLQALLWLSLDTHIRKRDQIASVTPE